MPGCPESGLWPLSTLTSLTGKSSAEPPKSNEERPADSGLIIWRLCTKVSLEFEEQSLTTQVYLSDRDGTQDAGTHQVHPSRAPVFAARRRGASGEWRGVEGPASGLGRAACHPGGLM